MKFYDVIIIQEYELHFFQLIIIINQEFQNYYILLLIFILILLKLLNIKDDYQVQNNLLYQYFAFWFVIKLVNLKLINAILLNRYQNE